MTSFTGYCRVFNQSHKFFSIQEITDMFKVLGFGEYNCLLAYRTFERIESFYHLIVKVIKIDPLLQLMSNSKWQNQKLFVAPKL